MMKHNTAIIGIIALLCIGCTFHACKEENHEKVIKLHVVNKDNLIPKVKLSDMIDSIQYTVLETSDSCLLGEITMVKKADEYFFVRDNFGLYVFDEKGKFINEISRKANGNQEYVHLDNFYIDNRQKLVGLICNISKKIMFFSYEGKYHSTVRLQEEDAGIHSIMQSPESDLLAYYPLPNDMDNIEFEYKKAQLRGNELTAQPLIAMKDITTKDIYYAFTPYPLAVYKDTCFLLSALSHNLYAYKNGKIQRTYQFDLPRKLPNARFWKQHKNENFHDLKETIRDAGLSVGFTGIQANENYLFLSVNDESTLIWDGRQGILINEIYDSEQEHSFYNIALSGGCSNENIGYYNADFLFQLKKKRPLRDSSLNRIVQSVQEHDNPILYQFIFKENLIDHLRQKYNNHSF